ncbi:peptidase G2 autoproteolytic cleavage domain-containing protein [Bacillus wiedmannii]|uniref:peptidase G2 autoproteolytic cleavage domain-containing protein n=1 Tax=Bacillus wiedmannii TaxID=1890302 RepID=UPI000BF22D36|nr:peptidase G2 autoproteolytic cleavage domain-containing protein [Bacillus wiedmannii]PEO39944.1 hypothetical protein CN555_06475 [Bacillus wiedmannii]
MNIKPGTLVIDTTGFLKYFSSTEGNTTTGNPDEPLQGDSAHAEGTHTIAQGIASHSEGSYTTAQGIASHSEGSHTVARADFSHVEGANTLTSGIASHAEGNSSVACGNNSHVEGSYTTTGNPDEPLQGDSAHAEGYFTIAQGDFSHAEGNSSVACGNNSHVEGSYTSAGDPNEPLQGDSAHAEGYFSKAYGNFSHAEGYFSFARGNSAHAEGLYTIARGDSSHAQGAYTIAQGDFSHAEGVNTQAIGAHSHVEGIGTIAKFNGSHILGKYGDSQEPYSWFIGNGLTATNKEIGAKWLTSTRNMYIDGNTYVSGGSNYAEMYEIKGAPIDTGFFVTLQGEFVRKANSQDDYILGITSATPSILGNSAEMRWHKKYIVDEWGQIQYKNTLEDDLNCQQIPMLSPEWDANKVYIPRRNRAEWVVVGLLGQIAVRDDGTCEIGGLCSPTDDGIATKACKGYKVMKRLNPNQIVIILK